ncbi:putative methyltransferase protein [Lasiodiplodia theobromae]|uniref:Aspirochlorine biosynthesis protein N n=2 Tax=Lasiodiplodia TaxID=66739 RepID=A0A5N5DLQ8_9PEZI|nr:Methyltransferase protein [Lasiodiplodia theobromae]KAB2578793.1 hypothetical protein DBV05_g2534 [Lasiodiplodia theobromae]KAF4535442.1 Methyltransferase protein [Lasiodiplodia theobromae]KAF9638721.1 putative methyltransferase protein [Lasiodiplodia theobromae]KAK0660754.1 hypothetical protein DIS24_g3102 [Lasiodiplodia hormozganensis]
MTTTATQPTPAHQLHSAPINSSSLDTSIKNKGFAVPRGPVTTELNFFNPPSDGSAPYNFVEKQPEGVPQSNFGATPHDVTIQDARGREQDFDLDKNSFAFIQGVESEEKDFVDDDSIKQKYYPEVEKIILDNVPGANRVLIFDHTIRRAGPNANRAPVTRTHIDQTPVSAKMRVEYHLPDEAEKLVQGRYRIINVWRPLNGPVVAHPLAFADGSTFRDEDLVPVEHRYPHRTGYTAAIKYNPDQQWYYLSGMRNDERLLLKCSDSFRADGRVPHTAFVDPRTPEGAPGRESIEVRALVFG